ncbi:hypothetical protein [Flavobacterium sp. JP2137]|uniref:hypothetical protein n=1 Tax=Flavobacterium sp. JP2137 TaxID=3414510 RepID=UPI003D2FF428
MEILMIIIIGMVCLTGVLYVLFSKGPAAQIKEKIKEDPNIAEFVKAKTERELLEQQVTLLVEIRKESERTAKNSAFITWWIIITSILSAIVILNS